MIEVLIHSQPLFSNLGMRHKVNGLHATHRTIILKFGYISLMQRVVREMNRLGMMVDISHVNNYTMVDVLDTTLAPGEWEGSQGRLWGSVQSVAYTGS